MSDSVSLRKQGNKFFSSISGKCASLQKMNLEKALMLYYKALKTASQQKETASAAKNIGVTCRKLASLATQSADDFILTVYYFKEALKHFVKAHNAGNRDPEMNWGWRDDVIATMKNCFEEAVETARNKDCSTVQQVQWIEEYIHILDIEIYQAEGYLEIAEILFKQGTKYLDGGHYKQSLNMMAECYRPIEEAKRLVSGENESILKEIGILEEDVNINRCVAESLQARRTGDELFDDLLQNEESLNMDMVYEVIDWYKKAAILSREREIEMEAIASNRLGVVYNRVLKQKVKAKEYFMLCLMLAKSCHPKFFDLQDWYKVCVSTLERYQKEVVQQESEKWQNVRTKFIKELTEEIKLLQNNNTPQKLLTLIYKKFPPKKNAPKRKIPDEDDRSHPDKCAEMKKALQLAIVDYHPDRQAEHGEKWKVLCEEIVKCLTNHYMSFKG